MLRRKRDEWRAQSWNESVRNVGYFTTNCWLCVASKFHGKFSFVGLLLFVIGAMPRFIRVVELHRRGDLGSIRSQVLLVNDAVVADDKCLYSRNAVFRRPGNQREAADHGAFHYIVEFSERRCWALALQSFEMVAVVGLRFVCVAFFDSFGDRVPNGSALSPVRIPPSQTILFAGRTDNALSVLINAAIVVNFRSVFLLSLRIATADDDRIQFVASYAAVKNLGTARLGIEMPLSGLLHDGYRRGPIFVSDVKDGAVWVLRIHVHVHFPLRHRGKCGARILVLDV